MKSITISDIAKRAGVSKATVSRVLNSPEKVEEKTRANIQEIMKKLHYTPSATARNLSKQVSSTVGVIVPEISNIFFGELFTGIEEVINQNNLSLLYCSNEDNMMKDFEAINMMKMQRVRGVLYIPAVNYSAIGKVETVQRKLENLGCPVICIDRDIRLKFDTIHFNDSKAIKEAVVCLGKEGHDRIAFINGNNERNILASERYAGYLEGLKVLGIQPDKNIIFQGEYKKSYAYLATKELIKMSDKQRPSAVITGNNNLGRGYLQAVYEENAMSSFAHISLDQLEMLDLIGIKHNYIKRDSYEMGKRAGEMLINRLAFPEKNIENILLEAPLVIKTF